MSLQALLIERRESILKRWVELLLGSYSEDAAVFLRKQKDQFANPVGHAISRGLSGIFDVVVDLSGKDTGEVELENVRARLDDVLRIRAVQQFAPSVAVAFIFQLKDALREEMGKEAASAQMAGELGAFDRRVDRVALMAFDVYTGCREQIYELRLTELRNQVTDVKERVLRKRGKWNEPEPVAEPPGEAVDAQEKDKVSETDERE